VKIAARLVERGATVVAYDPMAKALERFAVAVPGVLVAASVDEALEGADAAALVTEWGEFRRLDWSRAAKLMRRAVLVDGRNALSPQELTDAGFSYASFGRGAQQPARRLEPVMDATQPADQDGPADDAVRIGYQQPFGISLDLALSD